MSLKKVKPAQVIKVLLVLWIVFATLYVVYGEYNRLKVFVYNRGINDGASNAVAQIMTEASKCQSVPLTLGESQMNIVSLECLQKPTEGEETQ